MSRLILILLFFRGFLVQAQIPVSIDTHNVLDELVVLPDSFFIKHHGKTEILRQEDLQAVLKPLSRYRPVTLNFSKYYIAGSYQCIHCLAVCRHEGEIYAPCHRNACQYSYIWRLMPRKTIPVEFKKVEIGGISPVLNNLPRKDTVIVYEKNASVPLTGNEPEYIYLHALLGGDCHARFKYDLFRDEERKTITWVIHNFYGGCRAGYFEEEYLQIKNPGAGYTFVFSEVLEKR